MLFEMIKLDVRGRTIEYSSQKKRAEKQKEIEINKEINQLEGELEQERNQADNERINARIKEKKEELESVRLPKIKGLMMRARA